MKHTSCPEILRTQAWLDGELDEIAGAEAERHSSSCPECRVFVADCAVVSDALRTSAVRWSAPPLLRKRIAATIVNDSRRPRINLRSENFWFGAAGGAGLSALAAATALFLLLPVASSTLIDSVTDAHTSALMDHRAIAVVSSNHHTVKPWFAGRINVSPPVADFAAEGFPLAGGRIDSVAGAPAAVVVYRHGGHEIDLFAWADTGNPLPPAGVRHGYRTIFWKSADLNFAAISDTDRVELTKFEQLVRSEKQ